MQRSDERLFYVVQFTNVTWGEDLGATIDTYVTGKTEAVPRWKQYIRNVPVGISVPLAVTVTLIASLAALMGSEVTGAVTTVGTINTKYGDFSKLANSLNTVGSKIIVPRRLYNTKNADRTNISIFVCKNWHCVSCDCVRNRAALNQREKFHKSQRCFA